MDMKNKKATTVWNTALKYLDENRISEMREVLNVPTGGFKYELSFEQWLVFCGIRSLECANKLHEYRDEIAKSTSYLSSGFNEAIEEYLIQGVVSSETLDKCDPCGCQLKYIGSDEATEYLPMGVYVLLGPHSTPTEVRSYLQKKKKFVESVRALMYPKRGSRPKNEDFNKNDTVYWLGTMPLDEIREMASSMFPGDNSVNTLPRDILGSRMMKRFVWNVSEDNFRRILARERKKRLM